MSLLRQSLMPQVSVGVSHLANYRFDIEYILQVREAECRCRSPFQGIQWPSVNAVLEVRHSESAPVERMCLSQQVLPDNEGIVQCFLLSCNLYCIPCVQYYHSMPMAMPWCIYQGPRER